MGLERAWKLCTLSLYRLYDSFLFGPPVISFYNKRSSSSDLLSKLCLLSSENCSNNLIKPEMGIMANFDSYSIGQKYRWQLGLSTDGVWNLSTKKKKEIKNKEKLAQHESGEPTFIWGKMKTVAQKTESQIALWNCSKQVEGKVNICDFAEGQFHAIKHVSIGFLLVMMSWRDELSPWRDLLLFYIWGDLRIGLTKSVPENI